MAQASMLAIQPAACMSIAMGSVAGLEFHSVLPCRHVESQQPGMLRDVGESGLDLVKLAKRGGMPGAY